MNADAQHHAGSWRFVCRNCSTELAYSGKQLHGCPSCGGPDRPGLVELEVVLAESPRAPHQRSGRGLERYLDVLPPTLPEAWLSLGEGGTALVRSRVIGKFLGLDNLWFKLEHQNPTLSFKDRYVAVTVNVARAAGYRRLMVSSTGNLGISVAAYAAAAGMECLVIVPDGTPDTVLSELALYGATVALVDKAQRFQAFELGARHADWFPVGLFANRAVQNPYGIEGYKTIAYETLEALGRAPAAMLFPCARGNGLYGTWKGFTEAMKWGWSDGLPRMVACQPAGANSIEVSLQRNSEAAVELPEFDSVARSTSETVASDAALAAIRNSNGAALSATDDEIIQAVRDLGREGLSIEASSALPVACVARAKAALNLKPDDAVVCVLTATGIRWPEQSSWSRPNIVRTASLEEFSRLIDRRTHGRA